MEVIKINKHEETREGFESLNRQMGSGVIDQPNTIV